MLWRGMKSCYIITDRESRVYVHDLSASFLTLSKLYFTAQITVFAFLMKTNQGQLGYFHFRRHSVRRRKGRYRKSLVTYFLLTFFSVSTT